MGADGKQVVERINPYATGLIADYIIGSGGGKFDQLQVIKLAFLSYGHMLAQYDRRLFKGVIEAWRYGPVVPSIYDMLKDYGHDKITELQYCETKLDSPEFEKRMRFISGKIDTDARGVLDAVIVNYGKLRGPQLVELTHRNKSPWARTYKPGERHTVIEDRLIKEYYSDIK